MSKINVGELEASLNVEEHFKAIPMVGWHDSRAKFDVDDEEWTVTIAGGCRSIWVTTPEGRDFSVSVGEILGALVPFIQSKRSVKNEQKRT